MGFIHEYVISVKTRINCNKPLWIAVSQDIHSIHTLPANTNRFFYRYMNNYNWFANFSCQNFISHNLKLPENVALSIFKEYVIKLISTYVISIFSWRQWNFRKKKHFQLRSHTPTCHLIYSLQFATTSLVCMSVGKKCQPQGVSLTSKN